MSGVTYVNEEQAFIASVEWLSERIHQIANGKGFHEDPFAHVDPATREKIRVLENAAKIGLIMSEGAEALEGLRIGNPDSDKILGFGNVEEELADVVIRCFDQARKMNLDLPGAIVAKVIFNAGRPHKHGGKLF